MTTKPTVYDQHATHFANVSAYVIAYKGAHVAKIAFHLPKSRTRLYAYVHWLGVCMERGVAGGGGYDRRSTAAANAAEKIQRLDARAWRALGGDEEQVFDTFRAALTKDDGTGWERALREAGFDVWQAV